MWVCKGQGDCEDQKKRGRGNEGSSDSKRADGVSVSGKSHRDPARLAEEVSQLGVRAASHIRVKKCTRHSPSPLFPCTMTVTKSPGQPNSVGSVLKFVHSGEKSLKQRRYSSRKELPFTFDLSVTPPALVLPLQSLPVFLLPGSDFTHEFTKLGFLKSQEVKEGEAVKSLPSSRRAESGLRQEKKILP